MQLREYYENMTVLEFLQMWNSFAGTEYIVTDILHLFARDNLNKTMGCRICIHDKLCENHKFDVNCNSCLNGINNFLDKKSHHTNLLNAKVSVQDAIKLFRDIFHPGTSLLMEIGSKLLKIANGEKE